MAATAAAGAARAPFHVGMKEIYLPNFTVTLHRTPKQPPQFASFTVPLWFSKLDLRDYLFHAYNVRIGSVRSYVKLQRLQQGKPLTINGKTYNRPEYKRWHRPPSVKYMTVELERPFVWPEEQEDLGEWNQDQYRMGREVQKEMQQKEAPTGDTVINKERREAMRDQAKALLEGRAQWKPTEHRFTARP